MILLDTDILLDVLQRRPPRFAQSAAVLESVIRGDRKAAVAAHGLTTLYYLIRKSAGDPAARRAIDSILGYCAVAPVGEVEIKRARSLAFADFEDGVVAAAAESFRCEAIVTGNVADFAASPVPALHPAELDIDAIHEAIVTAYAT